MTKVVCISDTHCLHHKMEPLPLGDILIHAGDFGSYGHRNECIKFLKWFNKQEHPNKIFIAGNHDRFFEDHASKVAELLSEFAPNTTYLKENGVEVNGLKIWGSPYQPEFCNWAFNVPRGDAIQEHWDKIPDDTDVLITHGPPYAILDYNYANKSVGCSNLATTIHWKLEKLKLHIFGHVHAPGGSIKEIDNYHGNKVKYVNASVVNENYILTNPPVVVEL